jgi:hypothetical protein
MPGCVPQSAADVQFIRRILDEAGGVRVSGLDSGGASWPACGTLCSQFILVSSHSGGAQLAPASTRAVFGP